MVNKPLLHPQEIEVFYIIPALRRSLARYMKQQGMKQKDIAALLGVNTAAISQYTSNKRGHKVEFDEAILQEIQKSAQLIEDKISYFRETQRLLRYLRQTNVLCQIHKQFTGIPAGCEPQIIGCHHRLPEQTSPLTIRGCA